MASIKQKIIFFLLPFFGMACILSEVYGQTENGDKIIAGGKLNWENFTGKIPDTPAFWAMTRWSVYYKYKILSFHGDTVITDLKVWPVLKENSWVLPNRKTDELLLHEQGHFNFALLITLQFKKVADSTILLKNNYDQKLDSIFHSILNNILQMEFQYDEETNHMMDRREQKKWNKKIDDLLKEEE